MPGMHAEAGDAGAQARFGELAEEARSIMYAVKEEGHMQFTADPRQEFSAVATEGAQGLLPEPNTQDAPAEPAGTREMMVPPVKKLAHSVTTPKASAAPDALLVLPFEVRTHAVHA
jgi:hypothetical protein